MNYIIMKLTEFFGIISNSMIAITGSHNKGFAYLLAIIIFTAIFKIILLPLTIKQTRSTAKMSKIQPKMKEIQNRYKNDPQKANEKVMELYKTEGVSPFSGCLPLIIQFPVFIAMYQVLYRFQGFQEVKFFTIKALPFFKELIMHGKQMVTLDNPILIALVALIPIISGITTYFQGIMMAPKGDDAAANTQKQMNTFMTLFTVYLGLTFQISLVIYWIVQNGLQMLQQYFIMKHMNKEEA